MQQMMYAAIVAALLVIASGPLVLPVLRRLKFGQSIRQEGPESHYAKAGTPTMGGVMILAALSIAAVVFAPHGAALWLALFVTLGHGALGFADDFIKVAKKRSLGLTARQKLLGQAAIAAVMAYASVQLMGRGTAVWLPGTTMLFDFGLGYYPFLFLVLVGTTNAVNLTDGLDGLAAGVTVIAAAVYAWVAYLLGALSLGVFCAALAGAALGFLRYNAHPARVFMGDTGSLALGGALATVAVLTRTELLLIVVGLVYVAEALSVMIQVTSYKWRGKRIFRMSPLHHHFELGGWSETRVVLTFWSAAAAAGLLAVGLMLLSRMGGAS
ncbi:phospho-N-acetylmuramoyl-pentapeptide-transferase [Azotosporobacter soli]|uniref:phospho-N-acetylmuramoyl-pentapeptide- transferase n=1 Tax=Azotosporobacter soli TaxID=3055040 RepID=UPI0031FF08B8